jgi:hypothetical protein
LPLAHQLPTDAPKPRTDALFEAAEQAAAAGVLLSAERLYYACLSASPRDPVVRFNLGNVVRDLGQQAAIWDVAGDVTGRGAAQGR